MIVNDMTEDRIVPASIEKLRSNLRDATIDEAFDAIGVDRSARETRHDLMIDLFGSGASAALANARPSVAPVITATSLH